MSSGREKDKAGLRKTSVSTAKQPVPANAKNTSLRKKSTLKVCCIIGTVCVIVASDIWSLCNICMNEC